MAPISTIINGQLCTILSECDLIKNTTATQNQQLGEVSRAARAPQGYFIPSAAAVVIRHLSFTHTDSNTGGATGCHSLGIEPHTQKSPSG